MAYQTIKAKYAICLVAALAWMAISIWLSLPWYQDLSQVIGWPLAIFFISFIAIIPGYMNAFVICSLLLDKRPSILGGQHYPPITILIAAYNEAVDIATTLKSIFQENYPNTVHVIVISDGSKDDTAAIVLELMRNHHNPHFFVG